MNDIDKLKENPAGFDITKCRVLVIDDNEDTRNLFKRGSQTRGYQVTLCENGEQGISEIKKIREYYHILFLDLVLPDMSGLDILSQVKRDRPEMSVVVITGFGQVDTAVSALKKGAEDYIGKPFGVDVIVSHIKRSVQHKELREKLYKSTIHISMLSKTAELMHRAVTLEEIIEYSARELSNIPLIMGASIYRMEDDVLKFKAADGKAEVFEKEIDGFSGLINKDTPSGFHEFSFGDSKLGWTRKPLTYRESVIGIVNIFHETDPPIDTQDWIIIDSFINQVSYAIASFDETVFINDIVAKIAKKQEIKQALEFLLNTCIEKFNGDRGCILLFDDHRIIGKGKKAEVCLISYASYDWELKEEGSMEKFASLCRVTIGEFDKRYFPVLKSGNIYEKFYKALVNSLIVSGIFIDEEQLLGTITIASNKENSFSEEQLRLLNLICTRAGPQIMLTRQRTLDRLTNKLNRFLNEADIRSEDFLTGFTRKVVDVLRCEACNIYILHEFEFYILKAGTSTKDKSQVPDSFEISDGPGVTGFLQYVADQRKVLRLNHPRQFKGFIQEHNVIDINPDDSQFPYLQLLGIPIVLQEKCIGVIEAAQHNLYKTFTIDDQKVLENAAFSLSRAIMSYKLYQKAKGTTIIDDGWIREVLN